MKEPITYYFRNKQAGFSIAKAFNVFISTILDKNIVEVPYHNCSIKAIILNCIFAYRNRNLKGINHITGDIHYILPVLFGCKTVLTIHDTSAYDCCTSKIKRLIIGYLWFKLPLKCATKVTCISENTKKNISPFSNRKDIVVIHNPVDSTFVTELNTKFDIKSPNFLMIGTAWNKNVVNTLKALDGMNGSVTIIGRLNQHQRTVSEGLKNIRVINKILLDDIQIAEEYKNADIVLFCTIFEGFGMPIIEAQKVGRVVVTSNIEPHKEVAGNAAVFVDPNDVNNIKNSITELLNDEALYHSLVQKGLQNVKRFDVNLISQNYQELYMTM